MTQMLIKSPGSGETVTLVPPLIEVTGEHVSSATTFAAIYKTDFFSNGATEAYVGYEDREGDEYVGNKFNSFPYADYIPTLAGEHWFRVFDAGSVDTMRIFVSPTVYDYGDEVQTTSGTPFIELYELDVTSYDKVTVTGHVFLDICEDASGAPDGNWNRYEIVYMNTASGAEPPMIGWGDWINVEDVGASPEPKLTFLANAGSGPSGQCNMEWTTQEGMDYAGWYRTTPQTQGDFELWIDIVADPDTSLVVKDYLGNTQDISGGYADDFEMVGAEIYLDMSGASVNDEYTATITLFQMNTNNEWREVLRRVTLYGKKTS